MSDFNEITANFFVKGDDGVVRNRREDCNYRYDYAAVFQEIADRKSGESKSHKKRAWEEYERQAYRKLLTDDLFFMVHFGMGVAIANHPFIVDRCREVEDGPQTYTLDVWARAHGKSLIITTGETVQKILRNPEHCHLIFSYKAAKSQDFLAAIRSTLERQFLIWCFPEILYADPYRESPSWSLQGGITVKRKAISRKERTVEAYGLIEGMPTGGHHERICLDDVETADLAENPEQLQVLINKFEVAQNLLTQTPADEIRVIGTFYSHCGLLTHLMGKKTIHGEPAWHSRIIPATHDGTREGTPVFLTQESLDRKKLDRTFASQQLCSPVPQDELRFDYAMMQHISRNDLPKDRVKFLLIDPAGDSSVMSGSGDRWAFAIVSFKPVYDELGTSPLYLEDAITSQMNLSEAVDAACKIYMRNGRIDMIGCERTAGDTTFQHVINGLKAKGRFVSLKQSKRDHGNMVLLAPAGRNKNRRVESALSWPISNSQFFIVDTVTNEVKDILKAEALGFPYIHLDLMDAIAYGYDLLQQGWFNFSSEEDEDDEPNFNVHEQFTGRSSIGGY